MAKKSIIVAVAQMKQGDHLGHNLQGITEFAEMARDAKADLVCFPECALTGYGPEHHESSADFDPDAVEAGLSEVKELARRLGITFVLGAHLPLEGGYSNSALLIRSNGRIAARYDKTHLYGEDVAFYRAGRERPSVATAKGVRIGMQICFDVRFPEPFRYLAGQGAQIIFAPSHIHGKKSMWKGPVMTAHIGSRAAENGRFIVLANAAGATQNVPSMIADPRGDILSRCRRGAQQLLVAKLDLGKVSDDFLKSRRLDLYPSLG